MKIKIVCEAYIKLMRRAQEQYLIQYYAATKTSNSINMGYHDVIVINDKILRKIDSNYYKFL